ncbi:MAG: hypothetical protein GY805_14550 [Chloroflexi bacterium]|nr:hypothetical protein [Chloroflexota bacterium]
MFSSATAVSISTFVQEGVKSSLTLRDFFYRDFFYIVRHALPKLPRLLRHRRALTPKYGKEIFPEKQIFPVTGDLTLVFTSREFQPESSFVDGRFQPNQLREAANQLLHNLHCQQAAKKIGQTFRQAGGFQRAADLLESMETIHKAAPLYDLFLMLP